jgi:ABC-type transport system involved in cytochrome bd biosynthesis fused ATPase/permease subunit
MNYSQKLSTAEIVQVTVEGVEQLEVYCGRYLPQFFYSMAAPVLLFIAFSAVSWKTGLILLLSVPLIPISIIVIAKLAKRMLEKYWGIYVGLGNTFLDNVQGLTTLKIYQADEFRHKKMNEDAEEFRKITMKVLFMQLASIVVMDAVAYGGAGLGIIMALFELKKGYAGFSGCFAMIMLSAEFFLPMRFLGSLFHVAMNGVAASKRIFRLLDLPDQTARSSVLRGLSDLSITLDHVSFSYDNNKEVIHDITMRIPQGRFISIVGESGCGKSTIANLISGCIGGFSGSILIGGMNLEDVREEELLSAVTVVTHNSYIFKGSVRSNLAIGKRNATDEEMWTVLEEVDLSDFVEGQYGLDMKVAEKGGNLSGGQCQRLAIARALLADSAIYVFDEATSNVDVESETAIMNVIHRLAGKKTVLLISHRLANVVRSECIYVMERGVVVEFGSHELLMENQNVYHRLYSKQYVLESGLKA